MPVTKLINSKATVKQFTNNDLPFQGASPVIASYYATSTAAQTIINLPFSIVASGANANTDIFWLFVDGRKLDLGASNDYQFTSVAADGSSAQVTLTGAIPVNLNIQAFKLGYKLESQFTLDNRFVSLFAAQSAGFQGFVDTTSSLIAPTLTTGSPAAGTFYSQISGRASITDLSQNLKAQMGIERIMAENVYLVPNESGPNGELVWANPNDQFGQIRYVGSGWNTVTDATGQEVLTSVQSDFIEVVFYGTGLNLLNLVDGAARDIRSTVDGGTESSNLYTTAATILSSRNYSTNQILTMTNNLTLGVHTVKIRNAAAASNIRIYGFEILNESSSVKVNSGIGYVAGQKVTSSAQSVFSYSAPATGTRGGRVLVYQNADGTIGKSFQAVDAASASYPSASHTNEEVVRVYSPREFGAGRSDDYSLVGASGQVSVFTLDDDTTTLTCAQTAFGPSVVGNLLEGAKIVTNNTPMTITFVGTGLDIVRFDNVSGGSDALNFSVDGGSTVALPTAGNTAVVVQKLVSGLPYGTHTVKITQTSSATWRAFIAKFIVYQPKTPALPSGSVAIGSYNVMSNYVATSSVTLGAVSNGVLRKFGQREMIYVNTWNGQATDANFDGGWNQSATSATAYVEYTFFGTGVEWNTNVNTAAYNITVTIDGTNPTAAGVTTATLVQPGTGLSFTASTGAFSGTSSVGSLAKCRVQLSGLTLGLHKIRVTDNNTNNLYSDSFDIITPIHSPKSNLFADLQNSLPVGSNCISDDRQITAVKGVAPAQKSWAQAVGVTGSPTTTSTSQTPMPDMALTIRTTGNPLEIEYFTSIYSSNTNFAQALMQVYVDGFAIGVEKGQWTPSANNAGGDVSESMIVPVAAGTHTVVLYWRSNGGNQTVAGNQRTLKAREI